MKTYIRVLVTVSVLSLTTGIYFDISALELENLEKRIAGIAIVNDLLMYAQKNNPAIQASRQQWKAAVELYRVVTGWPDPQIMVIWFTSPIETRLGPQELNATLTQPIPFPGKLNKAGQMQTAEADIARLNLEKNIRDISVAVLESYYELYYIRKARRIALDNSRLLDRLRLMSETAYADNRGTVTDFSRAQSQTAQLKYDELLLEELEQAEQTRLNSLLNRDPNAVIGRIEEITIPPVIYSLDDIQNFTEKFQAEIQIAAANVDKARIKKSLSVYENLPEFKLGIFYSSIGEPENMPPPDDAGRDAFGIQIGMNIPLWFGKNNGRTAAAKAEEIKAQSEKQSRVQETRAQIHSLYFRLNNSQRLIALYRDELIPQAQQTLETAETWFRQGQGSFSDLTEAQATLYNFQLTLSRAKADYGKQLAQLEGFTGRSLTHAPKSMDQSPTMEVGQ